MAILKFEGQSLEIPDQMATNEKALLEFVATFSPQLANATISTKKEEGLLVVTLVKRAGTKGNTAKLVAALTNAPEYINPALSLAWGLKKQEVAGSLDLDTLLTMQPAIEEALTQGQAEVRLVEKALARLQAAQPQAASQIIAGF